MNIVIGTDHRGFAHKEFIKQQASLADHAITWIDVGAYTRERNDYPVFAIKACETIKNKQAERGVLLCGSGIGMSITANRYVHIYAALVWREDVARSCAAEDKANVLVIPADFVTPLIAVTLVTLWLQTPFAAGRYEQRIAMIDALGDLGR